MKSFFALFVGLLISLATTAQIRKDPTNWSAQVDKQPAKVGDVVSIKIQVSIGDGWHMYSNDLDPNVGPVPTSFKFANSDAFALVGKTTPVGVEEIFEEVWGAKVRQFKNKAVFIQKVKVLKPTATFSGTAEYQVCSDKDGVCLPPTEIEFSAAIKASEQATAPAATSATVASTSKATTAVTSSASDTAVAATAPVLPDTADATASTTPIVKEVLKQPVQAMNESATTSGGSLWGFMLAAFLSGLVALLTPCSAFTF